MNWADFNWVFFCGALITLIAAIISALMGRPMSTLRKIVVSVLIIITIVLAGIGGILSGGSEQGNSSSSSLTSSSTPAVSPNDINEEPDTGNTTSSQAPLTSTTVAISENTEYLAKLKPLKLRPSHPDIKTDGTIEVDSEPRPNSISYLCIQSCGEGNHEAHIIYNLSRDWNRLEMHVGLANETISYDQVATFTFKINGTPVHEETVKKGEPMAHVSLDVSDADSLELVASSNKTGERALLVWVSPTLTK